MSTENVEEEAMKLSYDRAKYGVNRQDLDAMGERAVRDVLNSGKWGHAGLAPFAFVAAWLADKEFVRAEASSAKRDAREERTLHIAIAAMIIAAIAAHNEIKWLITSVMAWLP